MLEIEGRVVTTDAMGTQKDIAKQIVDQKGDYLLAIKDNHPNLAAPELRKLAPRPPPRPRLRYS